MDSLTLLASLRPRVDAGSVSVIVPPVSSLRSLQRQLPMDASPGWHGTLSDDKPFALRDDTTLNVQNVPAVAARTPATTPAAGVVPPATPSYTSANYANFSQNYRTTYSAQPNTPYAQNTSTPAPQRTQTQGTYQFNPSAYAQWLAQTQSGSASQAGTPARLSTPQMQPSGSTAYFPFNNQAGFGNNTPTKAVANTIVSRLQAAVGMTPSISGGGTVNGGLAVPAHMRQQASAGSPLAYSTSGFP